jgi:hypothetical protein
MKQAVLNCAHWPLQLRLHDDTIIFFHRDSSDTPRSRWSPRIRLPRLRGRVIQSVRKRGFLRPLVSGSCSQDFALLPTLKEIRLNYTIMCESVLEQGSHSTAEAPASLSLSSCISLLHKLTLTHSQLAEGSRQHRIAVVLPCAPAQVELVCEPPSLVSPSELLVSLTCLDV